MGKPESLVIFAHLAGLDGASRCLLAMATGLVRSGVACDVVLPNEGHLREALRRAGCGTAVVGATLGKYWWFATPREPSVPEAVPLGLLRAELDDLIRFVASCRADAIVSQTLVSPWGAVCAESLQLPHVLSAREHGVLAHALPFTYGFDESIAALRATSDAIMCVSEDVREVVFGKDGRLCSVVYTGFDEEQILASADRAPPGSWFSGDGATVSHPATICPAKGQLDLVRALLLLRSQGMDVRGLFTGGVADRSYLESLVTMVATEGESHAFRFLPFQEDVYPSIRAADVLVVCSRREALGRTPFEASLLGTPVVFARRGGLPELFQDGVHGLSYEPGDHHGLADRIRTLLLEPWVGTRTMRAARDLSREMMSIEAFTQRCLSAISPIVRRTPVRGEAQPMLSLLGQRDASTTRFEAWRPEFAWCGSGASDSIRAHGTPIRSGRFFTEVSRPDDDRFDSLVMRPVGHFGARVTIDEARSVTPTHEGSHVLRSLRARDDGGTAVPAGTPVELRPGSEGLSIELTTAVRCCRIVGSVTLLPARQRLLTECNATNARSAGESASGKAPSVPSTSAVRRLAHERRLSYSRSVSGEDTDSKNDIVALLASYVRSGSDEGVKSLGLGPMADAILGELESALGSATKRARPGILAAPHRETELGLQDRLSSSEGIGDSEPPASDTGTYQLIIVADDRGLEDALVALREYWRQLRPGGVFAVAAAIAADGTSPPRRRCEAAAPAGSVLDDRRLHALLQKLEGPGGSQTAVSGRSSTAQYAEDSRTSLPAAVEELAMTNGLLLLRKRSTPEAHHGRTELHEARQLQPELKRAEASDDSVRNGRSEPQAEAVSRAELETLRIENARLNALLAAREAALDSVLNSRSWRLTAVIRRPADRAKQVASRLRFVRGKVVQYGGAGRALRRGYEIARREGMQNLFRRFWQEGRNAGHASLLGSHDYQKWVVEFDTLDDNGREAMAETISGWAARPTISVVMPVYDPPIALLKEAVRSVTEQAYPEWELCIADDASTDEEVRDYLRSLTSLDRRIKVVFRADNGHISAASNSALSIATGDFVAFLDQDDLLAGHALFMIASVIVRNPNVGLIYSDEDKVDEDGVRWDPYFKPDFNYELLLAQNTASHLTAIERSLLDELGGLRIGFEGSQDHDLVLRAIERLHPEQVHHVPRVLYHWRSHEGSTASASSQKPYAALAARSAVRDHLARRGVAAEVDFVSSSSTMLRVRYALPSPRPLVSLVIPTRDRADLLRACLSSIRTRTTYRPFEIVVVDNGSSEPRAVALMEEVKSDGIKVLDLDIPFNFSTLINAGVQASQGSFVCLLNNDIEVVSPDWLEELVSFAQHDDVGCVGARLWYPDGRLQHGGVVLGIGGVAEHIHKYLPRGATGYFGRASLHQSFSALTAACMLLRRSVFDEVGGFAHEFAEAFNDIDFCLRVDAAGYRNVWTPFAELIHHESATRGVDTRPESKGRLSREIELMRERWGPLLAADPAYNPNLSLDHTDPVLSRPPRLDARWTLSSSKPGS